MRPRREEKVDPKQVQAELIAASIKGTLEECSKAIGAGTITYGAAQATPVDDEALMKMHGEEPSLLGLFKGPPADQLSQLLWVYAHVAQEKPIFFQDPSGHSRSLKLPPEAAKLMEPYINHALLKVFLPRLQPHQTTGAILTQILAPMNWLKAATSLEGKTLHQRLQDATREKADDGSKALTVYRPASHAAPQAFTAGQAAAVGLTCAAIGGAIVYAILTNANRILRALERGPL